MLYLIKGSRVREYHRHNVQILSAGEGDSFEVSYSDRWIQTGLHPSENDGAVIVFADSPYEHFVPIRFAVVQEVEHGDGRMTLRGGLGPFVCTEDRTQLDARWAGRSDDERPGRHRFLVEDDNVNLFTPSSPSGADDAWRDAVDALGHNPFFESTTIVRVTGIELDGRLADAGSPLTVGDRATVHLELRSPFPVEAGLTASLLTEPDGSMALADIVTLPPQGQATLAVDVLEPGPVTVSLGLLGRTLTSTQITFETEVRVAPGERAIPPTSTSVDPLVAGSVEVVGLARFLHRNAQIDDDHWLQLLDDQLLPAAPGHPALLSYTAQHAAAVGRHDRVVAVLTSIDDRTPPQQELLLLSAVHLGRNELVPGLLAETDLSAGDMLDRLLVALGDAPESTVNVVLTQELQHRYLGDDRRMRLVRAVWPRLSSVDLLCRAAEDVAYLDPDAGAGLLLDRWQNPVQMPELALDRLLDWGVRPDRLGPYVRIRLQRAADRDDLPALESALLGIEAVARGDQAGLLIESGLRMASAKDLLVARRGLAVAVDGFQRALRQGDIDRAADSLPQLQAVVATLGPDSRQTVNGLVELLDKSIVGSEELARWERMRSSTRSEQLRSLTNGRRLFLLGGRPVDWIDELATSLGMAEHRWVQTDKDKSARHDWADDLRVGDIVLAVLPYIGHDSTTVKDKVLRQGAAFQVVRRNRMGILDGIQRATAAGHLDEGT